MVGPNGCGKSNIVDAIRWVMGEQRASQLRSSKMQDVIFSGTEDRPAMNMAEVSLFIQNDRGLLPSEFSEIQITRRAHRSGESEYLINNQECRLRDIQNLFFDTGMGAASYSLMEQRMIDAILSDKAEDRRSLFEEAAGVSKYKQQRRETLRQLERVRQDMERVEDNMRHARTSVRQHEKQVARAEEWKRVRNRLRGLELSMSLDNFIESREHLQVFVKNHQALEQERESLQTRLTLLESKIEEKRLSISGDEDSYRDLERSVGQLGLEHNNLSNQMQRLRDRAQLLEQSAQRARQEENDARARMAELHLQVQQIQTVQPVLQQEMQSAEKQVELLQEKRITLRENCETLREEVRDLENLRLQARQRSNHLMTSRERQIAGASHLQERKNQLKSEQELLNSHLQELQRQTAEIRNNLLEAEGVFVHASEDLLTRKSHWEELQETRLALESRNRSCLEEILQLESRLDVLHSMEKAHEGMDAASRFLLDHHGQRIKGILVEHLQVDPFLVSTMEFALGHALQTVLLQAGQNAQDLLQLLEEAKVGGALMAPENLHWDQTLVLPQGEGVLGPAWEFAKAPKSLQQLLQILLQRWILVKDRESAKALATKHAGTDFWFCFDNFAIHGSGLVRGGLSQATSGLLGRRQQIDSLQSNLSVLRRQKDEMFGKLHELSQKLSLLTVEKNTASEELRSAENALLQFRSKLQVAEARLQPAQEREIRIASELADIEMRAQEFLQSAGQEDLFTQAERENLELESQHRQKSDLLREFQLQLESCNEEWMNAQRSHQDFANRFVTGNNQVQAIEKQIVGLQQMAQIRGTTVNSAQEELQELDQQQQALSEKLDLLQETLIQEEHKRDAAKERYDVLAIELEDWRAETRAIHSALHEKASQLHEIEMRLGTLRTNLERLKERMFEAWEVDLENPGEFSPVEYDIGQAKVEVRDLREQLKRIGLVGSSVLEDFEAEKQKLESVEKQFADLDQARASLERTIARLDKVAQDRFMDTFRQIQRNFQVVFASLMVDGEARLSLADDSDPLEADIEVNARPTGKKMRGVRLLSGGERALTATALLFALYMVKPSPFCILDEVDGPLDDANIGRFVGLLRRFSRQTQFIIVTHNKRTMAASDMLYGVTQEIKGISRIASVKVDDLGDLRR